MFGQTPDIHFQAEGIAKEARETMHDDDIEGMIVVAGALDHFLKLGPVFFHSGSTRVGIMSDEFPTARGAGVPDLHLLIGNRQIRFRLSPSRNAKISASAQLRSDGLSFQRMIRFTEINIHGAVSIFFGDPDGRYADIDLSRSYES